MRRLIAIGAGLILCFGAPTSIAATGTRVPHTIEGSCSQPCIIQHDKRLQLADVFGNDDRRKLNGQERMRFNAIGIVVSSQGGMASAAVIEQHNLVVTSAHLFFEGGKLRHPLETFSFVTSGASGDWTRKKEYRIAEVRVGTTRPQTGISRDWAILRLKEEVSSDIRPFQLRPLGANEHLGSTTNIAFHGDLNGGGIPHVTTCTLRKAQSAPTYDRSGIFIHDCDATQGSSGSPLIVTASGIDYLVAINHGFFASFDVEDAPRDGDEFDPLRHFNVAIAIDAEVIRNAHELAQKTQATLRPQGIRPASRTPRQASPPTSSSNALSVKERLLTLKNLLEKGLITTEEAAAKRRQILRDL